MEHILGGFNSGSIYWGALIRGAYIWGLIFGILQYAWDEVSYSVLPLLKRLPSLYQIRGNTASVLHLWTTEVESIYFLSVKKIMGDYFADTSTKFDKSKLSGASIMKNVNWREDECEYCESLFLMPYQITVFHQFLTGVKEFFSSDFPHIIIF